MPLLNVTKKNTVKLSFPTFYGQCAPCTCAFSCHAVRSAKSRFIPLCRNRLFRRAWQYGKTAAPGKCLLISEHGIYTREREEEIIKASWIRGLYKNLWIEQFAKMSLFAYQTADKSLLYLNMPAPYRLNWAVPKKKRL